MIDFPDPSNGLPVTGVMQPLTSISGVLSVTNPDAMLRVEKLLLWHGKRAAGAVDPPLVMLTIVTQLMEREFQKSDTHKAQGEML